MREGDELVMKLDMEASALFMHVAKETFWIKLPPQPAWYIFVALEGVLSLELLPALPEDAHFFT